MKNVDVWSSTMTYAVEELALMTETDWHESADPEAMLRFIRTRVSPRKLRLFAVACCRRLWPMLSDLRSRGAVDTAERYADGRASDAELRTAEEEAFRAYSNAFAILDDAAQAALATTNNDASEAARLSAHFVRLAVQEDRPPSRPSDETREQATLLRHLVGNPFRTRTVDPYWLKWNQGVVGTLAY